MKTLIRKDLDWLLIFLIVGTFIPLVIVAERSFVSVWIRPLYGMAWECYICWCTAGLVMGVFAGIREELSRTEEYLRHRPVSPTRIFVVKTLACLVVISAWVVLPFALPLVFSGIWSAEISLAR